VIGTSHEHGDRDRRKKAAHGGFYIRSLGRAYTPLTFLQTPQRFVPTFPDVFLHRRPKTD